MCFDYDNGEMTGRLGYQGSIPVLILCSLILASYTAVAGLKDIEGTTPSSLYSACYNWKDLEEVTEGEREQHRDLIWSYRHRESPKLSKSHNSIRDSIWGDCPSLLLKPRTAIFFFRAKMTQTLSLQLESSAALTHMMDQKEEMYQLKDALVLFCVQKRLLCSFPMKEALRWRNFLSLFSL